MFKNKTSMILWFVAVALLICCFIYLGKQNYGDNTPDNIKISREFTTINEDNVYVYGDNKSVYETITKGTGIILCGFSVNKWTSYYINYLNEVAKENEIDKIIYYDFYDDRKENIANYELILESLDKYITKTDTNSKDLYAPTLIIVKEGKIIYYDDSTSFTKGLMRPEDYWTVNQIGTFKATLNEVLKTYLGVSNGE